MSRVNPQHVAEWLRCEDSFWYFCTAYGWVKDAQKQGGVIRFQPWPHLRQIAEVMQSGKHLMVGKGRQEGASWLAAMYDAWTLTFKPGSRILSISISQRESTQLLEKVRFVLDHTPPWMRLGRVKDNTEEIELTNGASIIALPSTEKAGRGEQATIVQTDEFAFHPYASENFASYHASIADGGQHLIITTGNGPTGMFYEMWHSDDTEFPYERIFVPWHARPDRAEGWYAREQAAFLSAGKKHPLLFIRENPATVEEMFTALAGLVYDMFTPSAHVTNPAVAYEDCEWRIAAVDPGQGDPAAIAVVGDHETHAHLYGPEFYQEGRTSAEDIYAYLKSWYLRAPLHAVVVDGAEGTLIATLNAWFARDFGRHGIVRAANKDRGAGIGLVASRLSAGTFSIGHECQDARTEFQSYQWAVRRAAGEADPYATSTPVDHHADLMDCIRYALMFIAQFCVAGTREVKPPSYAGEPQPQETMPKPDAKGQWRDPLSRMVARPSRPHTTVRLGPDYRTRLIAGRR